MSTRSWWAWAGAALAGLLALGQAGATQPTWTPQFWKNESTLKLCTTVPDEGSYCFPVWLVVLDDDVYVRLGSRAAERVSKNKSAPFLPVEIGGRRYEQVRASETPDYAERVAQAMANKYWSDIFARLFSHPLTMRLRPDQPPPP
ncbi:MAG: hypothetical protein HY699_05285 [Deltaproteobacteria bacterium]|nr:hypothetical protein [Deltaproteobacteria bacterium]